MSNPLSPHDWQLLSDFLDGQLSSDEQKRLEHRLQTQTELQNALTELRHTRAVLRKANRRRVPHNFTLTPEMVRQPSIWAGLFPVLRLSSALATLLVILTFALRWMPLGAQAPAAVPAFSAVEERAAANAVATETPAIILWGQGAVGKGGGGGGGGGVGGGPTTASTSETSAEAPLAEMAEATAEPTLPAALEAVPAPLATAGLAATAQPQASEAEPAADSDFILGLPAPGEEGKILEQPASIVTAVPTQPVKSPAPAAGIDLTAVQIALAAVAVITGVAAFYLQRRYQL